MGGVGGQGSGARVGSLLLSLPMQAEVVDVLLCCLLPTTTACHLLLLLYVYVHRILLTAASAFRLLRLASAGDGARRVVRAAPPVPVAQVGGRRRVHDPGWLFFVLHAIHMHATAARRDFP